MEYKAREFDRSCIRCRYCKQSAEELETCIECIEIVDDDEFFNALKKRTLAITEAKENIMAEQRFVISRG